MTRFILAVAGGLVCWTAHAADQTCPVPAFERPSQINLKTSSTSHNFLVRQPGGAYTAFELRDSSPYDLLGKTENFAGGVTACPYTVAADFVDSYPSQFLRLPSGNIVWAKLAGGAGLPVVVFDAGMQVVSEKLYFPAPVYDPANPLSVYGSKGVRNVQFADVNGDGRQDIVATTTAAMIGGANTTGVDVLLGDGTGGFTPTSFSEIAAVMYGGWTGPFTVGDLNGDGKADIVVGAYKNGGGAKVSVFLGNGDGSFQPEQVLLNLDTAPSLAVADWNRDGFPDLLFSSSALGAFRMLPGKGDGTWGEAVTIADGYGDLVVQDLDGDGNLDIVSAGTILFGDGKGGVARRTRYYLPGWGSTILADFDGDGKTDIVLGYGSADVLFGDGITVLFGRGEGRFAAPQGTAMDIGDQVAAATTADFDGDGTPELVINGHFSFHVMKASAQGTLKDLGEYKLPPREQTTCWAVSFATADFNGDGKLDLAAAFHCFPAPDFVGVFPGKGDGTFGEPVVFETEQNTEAIAVADFNRDGKPDLVAVNNWPADNVQIIIGNGDGTFVWPSVYRIGPGTRSVAVADFNGDGIPDVVAANGGYFGDRTTNISLLLGKGDGTLTDAVRIDVPAGQVFALDFDGDGMVDIAALDGKKLRILPGKGDGTFGEPVVTDFAYSNVILADLDGDGQPEFLPTGTSSPLKLPLVTVADFNGDGKPDIVAAEGTKYGVVYLFPQAVPTASTVSK